MPHEKSRKLCQRQNKSHSFHGECLVFEFVKSKGHQKGENYLGPLHVYTNLSKMWLCPFLSLSRYLFCCPDVLNGGVTLFKGTSHYTRYDMRLKKLVKHLDVELKRLGFKAGDLGSHSCRKGVVQW